MTNFTTALQSVCDALDINLVFADMNEANLLMDQLKDINFPALVVMPYKEEDSVEPFTFLKSIEIPFEAHLITKIEDSQVDLAKVNAQAVAVEPMLIRARQFMKSLNATAIIKRDNANGGIGLVEYTPTYSQFDANLFGVSINTTIPILPLNLC